MRPIASALFGVAAVVNLAPVVGVVSASQLEALYGITLREPDLVILMRHRAVLFGIVGALLAASVFRVALRPIALAAGLLSMLSFVLIAHLVGDFGPELRLVARVDLVASAALVGGGLATFASRTTRAGDVARREADT